MKSVECLQIIDKDFHELIPWSITKGTGKIKDGREML